MSAREANINLLLRMSICLGIPVPITYSLISINKS